MLICYENSASLEAKQAEPMVPGRQGVWEVNWLLMLIFKHGTVRPAHNCLDIEGPLRLQCLLIQEFLQNTCTTPSTVARQSHFLALVIRNPVWINSLILQPRPVHRQSLPPQRRRKPLTPLPPQMHPQHRTPAPVVQASLLAFVVLLAKVRSGTPKNPKVL